MTTIPASPDVAAQRAAEVAQEYRAHGYRVLEEPDGRELPEFLRGFRPDLVAFGESENVVIEIKSHATIVAEKTIGDLAEAVHRQPGWRLELVLLKSEVYSEILNPNAEISHENVQQALARSRALEHADLALVVAWGALELGMIHAARVYEVDIPHDVRSTVSTIYSFGLISYDEYKKLNEAWDARVRIIHGYKAEGELQPLVDAVIAVAEQLIANGMTA